MVGAGRFLLWILTGLYSAVPIVAIGAVSFRLTGRRTSDLDWLTATAIYWAAGWITVVAIGLATLATGCYTPVLWQVTALIVWLCLLGWQIATRWSALQTFTQIGRRALGEPVRLVSWAALLAAVAAAAALHASLPPDTRDELSYHLVMPELWAFQGDWWVPFDNFHLAFPGNCELMWGWAAAVAGLLAPRFITLVFAALTMVLLSGWMTEQRTPPWIRDLSLVFLAVTPVALTAASICYVEWPLLFFLTLGWRLSRRSLAEDSRGTTAWAAACWGLAVGIKYTAILFVGLLALEWLWALATRRRPAAAMIAVLALAGSVTVLAGPWFVRNWIATGDPVFPLGGSLGFAHESPHDPAVLSQYADIQGAWRWVPWLFHATADAVGDHRLHPLWPLLHLAVLAVGWKWRRELPWFTVLGATLALSWAHPAPRIYLPLMLLVWLFLPRMLGALPGTTADRRLVSLTVGLMAVLSLPIALHFMFAPGGRAVPDYLLGLSQKRSYLVERGLMGPTMAWVSENTSPGARIWAWCEDRTFYLERWARSDSPYGPPAFLRLVEGGSAASLDSELENVPVDYVLLRRDRCPDSWTTATFEKGRWEIDAAVTAELTAWTQSRLRELHRDGRHVLYRVRR